MPLVRSIIYAIVFAAAASSGKPCSSLDGPFCLSLNGIEPPAKQQDANAMETVLKALQKYISQINTPRLPVAGTFTMRGTARRVAPPARGAKPARRITMHPVAWTKEPPGWVMVSLVGCVVNAACCRRQSAQSLTSPTLHAARASVGTSPASRVAL